MRWQRPVPAHFAASPDGQFADAAALDSAAAALAARYGAPPRPIEVAVALPWLSPADASMVLPGTSTVYNVGNASQRMAVATWYLKQVQSMAKSANWTELSLYGITTSVRRRAPHGGTPHICRR